MQYNLELTVHVFMFKLKDLQSCLGFVLFLAPLGAVASEFSMQSVGQERNEYRRF